MNNRTVLVVDDEKCIREMMAFAIEEFMGAEVLVAGSVEEAKKLITEKNPSLVLTDINLVSDLFTRDIEKIQDYPRFAEQGWALIDFIMRSPDPGIREIPIVAMTGHSSNFEMLRRMKIPFVPKPFLIDDIRRIINEKLPALATA